MPLQFNPYPLEPWLRREEREAPPDFNQTVTQPLMQGLMLLQEQKKQDALMQLANRKEGRDAQQFAVEYGSPAQTSTASYNPASGQVKPILGSSRKPSMIERFEAHRKQNRMVPGAQGPLPQAQTHMNDVRAQFGLDEGYTPGMKHIEAFGKLKEYDRKLADDNLDRDLRRQTVAESMEMRREMAKDRDARYGFNQENTLRSQFLNQSKDFAETATAYQRIIDSSKEPSAAGDLALIFNYMKMLDPGSTVREGEFANAAASGSYGDRFQAAAQKIVTGQRLDDSMRQDFVNRATDLYQGQMARHQSREKEFQGMGSAYGFSDPSRVTPNLATPMGGFGGNGGTQPGEITKVLNGVTYVKRNGQWFQQ